MNRMTRLSLITVMLLSTTVLGTIAYQMMQPPPPPPPPAKQVEAPPKPPDCAYDYFEPKIAALEMAPLTLEHMPATKEQVRKALGFIPCSIEPAKAKQIEEYDRLTVRAARLFTDEPNRWKYIYEQLDKEPMRYIYWK